MTRKEFTGMLPAVIAKFEELMAQVSGINPVVVSGYNAAAGADSFARWGAGCRIRCDDMAALQTAAEGMAITWMSDDGDMAYTAGRTIADFQTYRVTGSLEMAPEEVMQ